jgi:hypothetical protein
MLLRVKFWKGPGTKVTGSVLQWVVTKGSFGYETRAIILLDDGSLCQEDIKQCKAVGWREIHHNPMNLLGPVP